jgi:tetratricopeptide (TPR) repeat protein
MPKILFLFFLCCSVACFAQGDETNEARKYYNAGAEHYNKGEFIEAIQDFSTGLKNRSVITDSYLVCDLYLERAMCRLFLGSRDAFADANEAVKIKPEYSRSYYVRSRIRLMLLKDADNALADVDTALRSKPGDIDFLMQKMTCYNSKKMYTEALNTVNKVLDEDSKNSAVLKQRAAIYTSLREYDSSIRDFKQVLEAHPDDFEARCDLGFAYAKKNDWENAKQYFLLSIKVADSNQVVYTYNNLAYFVGQITGDYKASVGYCDKAIEKNPRFAYSFSNRGFAKFKLGDSKAALKDIQKSIDMDPKNSYAYKNRALVLISENKISSACLDLNKAKQLDYAILYDDEVDQLLLKYCP